MERLVARGIRSLTRPHAPGGRTARHRADGGSVVWPLAMLVAILMVGVARPSLAQSGSTGATAERFMVDGQELRGRIMVVTADEILAEVGPDAEYYHIGTLRRGDVVLVTGEKFEWLEVSAVGPAFSVERGIFGFLKYDEAQANRLRVAADGRSAVTLDRISVFGPNAEQNRRPDDSWKPLVRLGADARLRILSTEVGDQQIVRRVVLPVTAEVYVPASAVRPATSEEAALWRTMIERWSPGDGMPAAVSPATPEPTASEGRTTESPQRRASGTTGAPVEGGRTTPGGGRGGR